MMPVVTTQDYFERGLQNTERIYTHARAQNKEHSSETCLPIQYVLQTKLLGSFVNGVGRLMKGQNIKKIARVGSRDLHLTPHCFGSTAPDKSYLEQCQLLLYSF